MSASPSTANAPAAGIRPAVLRVALLGLVFLAAGSLALGNFPKPGQPEKLWENFVVTSPVPLADLAGDTVRAAWRVRDGQLLQAFYEGPSITVTVRPVGGGAAHVLYRGTSADSGSALLDKIAFGGDAVFFFQTVSSRQSTSPFRGTMAPVAGPRVPVEELVVCRLPETPVTARPGDTLRTVKFQPAGRPRWQAQRISTDGASQVVTLFAQDPSKSSVSLTVGDTAFWCESADNEYTELTTTAPNGTTAHPLRVEMRHPNAALILQSLSGGPPCVLASACTFPGSTDFIALEDGVALVQPRAYPDRKRDLWVFRAPDYRRVVVEDYRGARTPAVAVARGRLWWLESGGDNGEGSAPRFYLVSVTEDGTDRRRVLLATDALGRDVRDPMLSSCRGRLFLTYRTYRPQDRVRGEYLNIKCHVATLRADGEPVATPFVDFPYQYVAITPDVMDGGYLYFVRDEEHRSPFDAFFEKNTARMVPCLYRIRVPQ